MADIVVVGGTGGLGSALAQFYADRGDSVVITGRDAERTAETARQIQAQAAASGGGPVRPLVLDLAQPSVLAKGLDDIERADRLVLTAIDRDRNSVREYDVERALALVTVKLVGYMETVHVLAPRMPSDGSILLFGGVAKDRPYPGSTTVTSINAGVVGMVATLARELAPLRVNSLHPGIVGDSPYWAAFPQAVAELTAETLTGRLATTADVVEAARFLLETPSVNAVNLTVDGGRR